MKASEVLRKAKGVLEDRGWCQKAFSAADGGDCPVCAWGAINVARAGAPDAWMGSASARLFFEDAVDGEGIASWNDHRGRSRGEVIAAFDRAIALAEAEESR